MKNLFVVLVTLIQSFNGIQVFCQESTSFTIPASANSWIVNDVEASSRVMSRQGIKNWTNPDHIIRTYFYVEQPGEISLSMNAKVTEGKSVIFVRIGDQQQQIKLSNKSIESIKVGKFNLGAPGYHFIEMQGKSTKGDSFAEIKDFNIRSEGDQMDAKFIKDDVYFGRRGPSTHLVYQIPEGSGEVAWLYNEIEIESGQDVIGSYFMANGFAEGYFGIQVNSETERRILFSVWSPYKTDNPSEIPEEYRITLLKKGDNVTTGKFGNEGSGGQSYKVFNWQADTRYGFLLGAKPTGNNSTDFTAYFMDPAVGKWQLIASFRRPKTDTHLKRMYSFLENFIPNTGVLSRKGGFYNQWVCNSEGKWIEIYQAKFSADNTARKQARLDYSGGLENDNFYLKNCGFTNDKTEIGKMLTRPKTHAAPEIDFSAFE